MWTAPTVKRDLTNVETRAQLLDERFDRTVVDHISFGRVEESLFFPQVVGNVVAGDPKFQVVFGNPKPRRNHIGLVIMGWWENVLVKTESGWAQALAGPPAPTYSSRS